MDEPLEVSTQEADVEGYDSQAGEGWDDYPLDAVFVRTEPRTVNDVVKRIRADRYELNPDFQRDFVWPIEKQSRLIESCLMRIPLPVFYVAEGKDGRIIVVDGLQRLSTFRRYLDNDFKLTFSKSEDLEMPSNPLAGKSFDELQLKLRERLEDTQLTLCILDAKAPERAKLDIFERVNSGEPLTRQQMRNCLYNGPATLWLRDASKSQDFLRATGGSLDSKKMRDREAINRFCAFTILGWESYRGEMDAFLASSLEHMNRMNESERDALYRDFERSMVNNAALFGIHSFRKSAAVPAGGRSVINIALFDVCSVFFRSFSFEHIDEYQEEIRATMRTLLEDEEFVRAITYSTNSRLPVRKRFSKMLDAFQELV